jgi:membrane protein YdbS with pleckstrin-like domain
LSRKVFAIKQYALRKHDVIYTSGWIIRNTTVLPFNRVQHVEIKHGPIDRMFGLSSLKIFTAGGSQSDMVIPGLERERAQRIKELIVNKTGQDEEE